MGPLNAHIQQYCPLGPLQVCGGYVDGCESRVGGLEDGGAEDVADVGFGAGGHGGEGGEADFDVRVGGVEEVGVLGVGWVGGGV